MLKIKVREYVRDMIEYLRDGSLENILRGDNGTGG